MSNPLDQLMLGTPSVSSNSDGTEVIVDSDVPLTEEEVSALAVAAMEFKQQQDDAKTTIARNIETVLNKRMGNRKTKEGQWLESMKLYLGSLSSYNIVSGEYPFGDKEEASRNNSRPEFNIIRQKCNIAIAQCVAHQFAAGDKNWDIRTPQVLDIDQDDIAQVAQATNNPNLSAQDVADYKCDLMEREIEYHLDMTKYAAESRLAIADRVILGTAVMKGPVNCGRLKRTYEKKMTSDGQVIRIPAFSLENTPSIYRLNLWYFFPDDSVADLSRAGDAIEVHPMSKAQLAELMQHPGYDAEEIGLCLAEDPRTYTNSPFNDPAYLTQGISLLKDKYLVIERHGPIKKEDLDTMGVEIDTVLDEVYGETWICNGRVIRLQTSTIEGSSKIPYAAVTWEDDPATVFGFGIPMLARDQQRVVNETYKMILDNAGISAGPQVIVDTTIIKPASGGLECTPFKVWYSTEYGADISKAIQFFTPPNSFDALSNLLSLARSFADEESSINLLAAGAQTPSGAMDSATGLALQNENALTPLFFKSEQWDDNITRPLIDFIYDWEMQYNPKDEIKGTFEIDVRTTTAYLKGVMDQQKLDRLFQEITQQSPVTEWINLDQLIEARLSLMKLPFGGIVKTPQKVAQERAERAQQPQQPDPDMLKAQAAMDKNEIEKQKLQLDAQRFEWDREKHSADLQTQAGIQSDINSSKIHERDIDYQKTLLQAQVKMHEASAKAAPQQSGPNPAITSALIHSDTQKKIAGLKHVESQNKLIVEQNKIEANARSQDAKMNQRMRDIRVNADAKSQDTANRDLTVHNPEPSR